MQFRAALPDRHPPAPVMDRDVAVRCDAGICAIRVYSEHTVAWGHWIGSAVVFRPELRFERAYDAPAYDLGTRHNQFSFGTDVIFRF